MPNQIMVIVPYWLEAAGTWVFDDPATDLKQEPFVEGIPGNDRRPCRRHSKRSQRFRLLFSAASFPGYQRKLTRLRQELGGWWYASDEPEAEGWLCPALFRYFDEAPEEIYVKAEAKR